MADVTVPMDDKELFAAATADEAPVETEAPAEAQEVVGQPRDEAGRFAPKTEEAPQADAAPTQQQPEAVTDAKDEGGNVPSWRLREIREERDAHARRVQEIEQQATTYQRQMAEMQRQLAELRSPKQEPVDFFADQDGFLKQKLTPYEERINKLENEIRMTSSRAMAVAEHGIAMVKEAEKAVEEAFARNDPSLQALTAQLRGNSDPVGAAIQWHSNNRLMKETGGNINAYRDKILAEAMKDPAYQAKVLEAARGQSGSPNIKLPPSLNKTAGSGVTAAELSSEDMSDRALFQQAVRR
jgi:chromosome segregation ATPase